MYSEEIKSVLAKKKISIGGRIKIVKNKKTYEGLLMPKTELGDPKAIVIKLDSGYNIGLKYDKNVALERSEEKEPKEVAEEERFELGRVGKKLLQLKFDSKKPPVSLIASGGTIASRVDYRTGGVYALEDPREFLHNVPELADIVFLRKLISSETKMSEDMNYKDWIKLAELAAKELNAGDRGVIITHGTDTLHYTAAAMSFFLRGLSKPVVLAGSQKSSDRGSSDAGLNIICSAYATISDIGEVGTCMHGSLDDSYCLFIRGTKVRKMDSVRRDAFRPINDLPLAKIWPNGKIEIINKSHKKREEKSVELDTKFEPKVALIKTYPGSDPEIIDFYAEKGYRGFVIEGTGLGHVPTFAEKSWTETIKKWTKSGLAFVVTTQTLYGRVNPNVYTNLRILYHEAKAIPGEDMLPEVAYIKLGWVLGHTKDPDDVRKMMATNYAGEITSRTLQESFLY